MKNVPAKRVSSNLCGTFITRQIRFRNVERADSDLEEKQTRLKYNRSMFARTRDELTELCLRVLMERRETKEKCIIESIEPTERDIRSIVRLSHKFEVSLKRGQVPEVIQVRCITSWEPMRDENKRDKEGNEQPKEVPLNDVFKEDPVVLRKLKAQFMAQKSIGSEYDVITGHQPYPLYKAYDGPYLEDPDDDAKNHAWRRVPKGTSYVSIIPLCVRFYDDEAQFYFRPPGVINEWIQLTTLNYPNNIYMVAIPRIRI